MQCQGAEISTPVGTHRDESLQMPISLLPSVCLLSTTHTVCAALISFFHFELFCARQPVTHELSKVTCMRLAILAQIGEYSGCLIPVSQKGTRSLCKEVGGEAKRGVRTSASCPELHTEPLHGAPSIPALFFQAPVHPVQSIPELQPLPPPPPAPEV